MLVIYKSYFFLPLQVVVVLQVRAQANNITIFVVSLLFLVNFPQNVQEVLRYVVILFQK